MSLSESFVAGGYYHPSGDLPKQVRQEIDYNGKELLNILEDETFSNYLGTLIEESPLKTAPKGDIPRTILTPIY